jgi:long-subunit fatty acid transport protein
LGQSAFLAVADDATAASWNPAGLTNLEKPEASFVGVWRTIENDLSTDFPLVTETPGHSWNTWEINFMSYAYPIEVQNRDAVLSVNYHQAYDLGLEYGATFLGGVRTEQVSRGAISAYSLAGGLRVSSSPRIAVGASFNLYAQSLCNNYVRRVEMTRWPLPADPSVSEKVLETLDDFRGHNFTLGALWGVYERNENLLTLGLVCHTPFTAKVDQEIIDIDAGGVAHPRASDRLDIDFPLSLGAGANYRFSYAFSAALDVQWTNWSEFTYTDAVSTPGSDAWAVRLGAEHLFFPADARRSVVALRYGGFYEPRPAWNDTLPIYGFSLGVGWTVRERFSLDFAYQFRWGDEKDFVVNNIPFDYGVEEHWLIGSIVTYF